MSLAYNLRVLNIDFTNEIKNIIQKAKMYSNDKKNDIVLNCILFVTISSLKIKALKRISQILYG